MNTLSNKKYKFVYLLIPLFVYLSVYKVGAIYLSYIIGFLYSIYIVYREKEILVNKFLILFLIYTLINQLILILLDKDYIINSEIINNMIMSCITVFIISSLSKIIEEDKLYRTYKIIGIIAMIGLLIHAISIFILNKNVYPIVIKELSDKTSVVLRQGINRPVSFFLEPQHYASYMLPLLFLSLKKQKVIFSFLITTSIIISTSLQGILIAGVLWIYYILSVFKGIGKKTAIIAIILIQTPFGEFAIDKLYKTDISTDIRITRGFGVFDDMTTAEKLTGIGPGTISRYISNTGRAVEWFLNTDNTFGYFISTYSGVLVNYGIIAGILFNILLISMIKGCSKENLGMFIIIFLSTLTQTVLFNVWFIFYFIIFFSICRKTSNGFIRILL